ncbi:hypothetical protein CVT24_011440 [Panaeolus cyanescens]|uniref:Uncharacterized protein n=1 Tax=Panaeolus cyanescens TaxID=181874 RepID=A0A409VGC5_9AGAR|nr:hypothetical protein CVT24_011440 [Panaeolus cyanescens]
MFEEICLVCGRHLPDDGRAYCNDDCQSNDVSSPSISSSSSALSSPSIGFAAGGDVPPLMPSALGMALKGYVPRQSYYSSTTSNPWSAVTDEEEDGAAHRYGSDFSYHDPSEPDLSSKPAHSVHPNALSYARRPSGINNRSTVPRLNRRLSSGSPAPLRLPGVPRSAPIHSLSSSDDIDSYSDNALSVSDSLDDTDDNDIRSEKAWVDVKPKYPVSKSKRSHNRASLPAYFSLLQMKTSSSDTSPDSSSGNTIARPSPPTPKLLSGTGLVQSGTLRHNPLPSAHDTPRGSRQESNASNNQRTNRLASYSRSRSRRAPSPERSTHVDFWSLEAPPNPTSGWSSAQGHLERGRATNRRSISPPSKMLMGTEFAHVPSETARRVIDRELSPQNSRSRPRTRGRTRLEDMDTVCLSTDAPGYGNGRSGLVDRERSANVQRIPL